LWAIDRPPAKKTNKKTKTHDHQNVKNICYMLSANKHEKTPFSGTNFPKQMSSAERNSLK